MQKYGTQGLKVIRSSTALIRKFKKAKTKTVNGYKKNKITIKKLKSKKKYYVRVRTILKIKGKTSYSKWSKIKTVKTK